MYTIYKYPVANVVHIPRGGKILHVDWQNDAMYLWALVETRNQPEPRKIVIRGTGHAVWGPVGRYICTFMTEGGAFVWHAFEMEGESEPVSAAVRRLLPSCAGAIQLAA